MKKDKGLGGAMFWQFAGDNNNELATAIADGLNIKNPAPEK